MATSENKLNQMEELEKAINLHRMRKYPEAEEIYKKLLSVFPENIAILNNLALINFNNGLLESGVALIQKSLSINPKQPISYFNLGNAFKRAGKLNEALTNFNLAIALKPDYSEAYCNCADILQILGKLNEALVSYDQAIAIKQNYAVAYCNRGVLLRKLNQLDQAVASYDEAIAIEPSYAEAYNNRGNSLKDLRRHKEALLSFDKAISLRPNYAEAYSNRAITLKELKRFPEALKDFDRAITIKPEYAEAHWDKGLIKLSLGQFSEGWELYEWRRKKDTKIHYPNFSQPIWLGNEIIKGKKILIYSEQGFGDSIQFCRYLEILAKLKPREIIFEVQPSLKAIMDSLQGKFTLIKRGDPLPEFDYHCPLMSLPFALKATLDQIPKKSPYLFADKEKIKHWKKQLGKKNKLRVGLTWSGSLTHKNDRDRSILLSQLMPLFELPFEFHSLQKEIKEVDLKTLNDINNFQEHRNSLIDFSDTAALLSQMDIIISVDSSVAHLAGALGKKTHILLPFMADFRWMLDRTDSPWYPTVTLFRQPKFDDWEDVITKVKLSLIEFSNN